MANPKARDHMASDILAGTKCQSCGKRARPQLHIYQGDTPHLKGVCPDCCPLCSGTHKETSRAQAPVSERAE